MTMKCSLALRRLGLILGKRESVFSHVNIIYIYCSHLEVSMISHNPLRPITVQFILTLYLSSLCFSWLVIFMSNPAHPDCPQCLLQWQLSARWVPVCCGASWRVIYSVTNAVMLRPIYLALVSWIWSIRNNSGHSMWGMMGIHLKQAG